MHAIVSPLSVALAYHAAWTRRDLATAMSYIAPDIVCDTPTGPIIGAEDFQDFIGRFAAAVIRCELAAASGTGTTALLMYDADTVRGATTSAAEFIQTAGGRITRMKVIFDRASFTAAHELDLAVDGLSG